MSPNHQNVEMFGIDGFSRRAKGEKPGPVRRGSFGDAVRGGDWQIANLKFTIDLACGEKLVLFYGGAKDLPAQQDEQNKGQQGKAKRMNGVCAPVRPRAENQP
jgi:hypothetical protein